MLEQLRKLVGEDHVWINEPMKNHTTFRAGGGKLSVCAARRICPIM